jgi:hypothetical protein
MRVVLSRGGLVQVVNAVRSLRVVVGPQYPADAMFAVKDALMRWMGPLAMGHRYASLIAAGYRYDQFMLERRIP